MKKWLLVLISLILVMCLTACGKDENSKKSSEPKKESAEQTAEPSQPPEPAATGDAITFGSYEQDNNPDNGPEPIEWIVLDVRDGKALLLSKYGLDAKPYNREFDYVTWETCTLRTWLNKDFLKAAFSKTEQQAILLTDVDNSDSQGFDWSTIRNGNYATGGNNTQDKIFLLSYAEANRYLGVQYRKIGDDDPYLKSRAASTAYAKARGANHSDSRETADGEPAVWWWLRSPAATAYCAANVLDDGCLYSFDVRIEDGVVRPALWIDLNSGT